MQRQMIRIDEALCNGCGACAAACKEGAIGMVDGKARLLRDDYCDGLGNCLPVCPTGAISFEIREAAAFDEEAALRHSQKGESACGEKEAEAPLLCGCPGSQSRAFKPASEPLAADFAPSQLRQWPVQIKLAPVKAPYFEGARLLVAADCSAYAYGDFHRRFLKGHVCLIGCPKLDEGDYTEKLAQIIAKNEIKSLSVVRMEVPCCGGLERAAVKALQLSGKFIPWQVVTLSTEGKILD